ncbi:MAG TPA: DegV family protein, partial [Streptosporangiaceae bacterium]
GLPGGGGRGPGGGTGPLTGPPALTARPLLHIHGGRIELLEKVRTRSAAIGRLTELAAAAARTGPAGPARPAGLAVQYLGDPGPARALAARLAGLIPGAGDIILAPADAVIAAHTGPGMLAVVVAAR